MRLLPFFVFFFFHPVQAQLDPSSAVLLAPGTSSPSSGLQSGRYESESPGVQDDTEEKVQDVVAQPVVKKAVRKRPVVKPGEIPMAVIEPKVRRWMTSEETKTVPVEEVKATKSEAPTPAVGKTEVPVVEESKKESEEDDLSEPRLQIELASGLVHSDAASNSVYRQFSSTSPLLGLGGIIWLNEEMGFAGHYQSTLSADIGSSLSSAKRVPVTREWSELQWNFRRPRKSAQAVSLQYGLVYFEDSLKAPADEVSRVSLKSSGFGARLLFMIPQSGAYSSTFEAALYPRIRHTESSTGLNLESGSSPNSTRLDMAWGGTYDLTPAKNLFWNLGLQVEKNQFEGTSNKAEPSGAFAEKVSVLTSTVFFHLGYRWGR